MGTTANLALPYPENTDPLANIAAAIKSLADSVDAKLTAAWTAYTPAIPNLTIGNGTRVCRYRLLGKTLQVRCALNGGTTTTVSGAMSLPLPAGLTTHASGAQTALIRHWNGAALAIGGGWIGPSSNTLSFSTSAAPTGIAALGNGHEIDVYATLELA